MSRQLSGTVSVDEGHRYVEVDGSSNGPDRSRVESRADAAGAWSDESGITVYGNSGVMPGMGTPASDCGEYYPEKACTECGTPEFGQHRCGRRSCPNCWGMWAKEAAIRGTVRIQAFRETQPDGYQRQAAHTIASPPEGSIRTWRGYWDGYGEAAELAKEKGMRGFAVVGHPWRLTEEGQDLFRAEMGEEPDVGAWVWVRNEHPEEWRDLTKWSPHYHIIGATSADMEPAKDSDEWVWRFRRSVSRYGLRDEESYSDLYGLFRYLLSHTGYPEESTKQVIRWYGELSNSTFTEEDKPDSRTLGVIERMAERAAEPEEAEAGEMVEEPEEAERCGCDGCDGVLIDVFDIQSYLVQADPPPEVARRLQMLFDWRMGRVHPPPGMKHPMTEEQAHEAFEALL